jgi:hypothetical protein
MTRYSFVHDATAEPAKTLGDPTGPQFAALQCALHHNNIGEPPAMVYDATCQLAY